MRNSTKLIVVTILGLMFSAAGEARATLTLNFENSLQPTTPAPGWSYLYNSSGPIGNPTNYSALQPTTDPNIYYDISGSPTLPTGPGNAYYTFFGKSNSGLAVGHPGLGYNQATNEGFAIAAYTLSSATTDVTISNGILSNLDTSQDGLDLRIYVNSTQKYTSTTAAGLGSSTPFNVDLGGAMAGDTIYVAVGSNGNHYNDSFHLNYDITIATPEPSTLISAGVAGLMGLGFAWRRRKASRAV